MTNLNCSVLRLYQTRLRTPSGSSQISFSFDCPSHPLKQSMSFRTHRQDLVKTTSFKLVIRYLVFLAILLELLLLFLGWFLQIINDIITYSKSQNFSYQLRYSVVKFILVTGKTKCLAQMQYPAISFRLRVRIIRLFPGRRPSPFFLSLHIFLLILKCKQIREHGTFSNNSRPF